MAAPNNTYIKPQPPSDPNSYQEYVEQQFRNIEGTLRPLTINSTTGSTVPGTNTPLMNNGSGLVGTSINFSREDHVHPSDTSRVPTTRSVNTGTGLTGGGPLSANLTLSLAGGAAVANLGFTPLNPANNLSDLANAATARGSLGLGSLATLNSINNTNWSGAVLSVANGGSGTGTPGLVAGSNVSITGAWPNQTISSSNPGGTVTSVALTMPSTFSVSGSPINSSGTLAVSYANQSANAVFAGPSSGAAAAPTFRALVGADLPAPAASTLGGVKSSAAATHQFATGINTAGAVTYAQPAAADISGLGGFATLSASQARTYLAADATLNNATYTDGPSVNVGTSGTFWVSGYVTVGETTTAGTFFVLLWDGTNVIASTKITTGAVNQLACIHLSGWMTNPAAALKFSVLCSSSASGGRMYVSQTGTGKDSAISAFRLA